MTLEKKPKKGGIPAKFKNAIEMANAINKLVFFKMLKSRKLTKAGVLVNRVVNNNIVNIITSTILYITKNENIALKENSSFIKRGARMKALFAIPEYAINVLKVEK